MITIEKYQKALELACDKLVRSETCPFIDDFTHCHSYKGQCVECWCDYILQQAEQDTANTKPLTNREWLERWLKSISDEIFANYMCHCDFCVYKGIPQCYESHDCITGHLKWLKAEHKE